jgi:hypothetical protein
MGCEAAVDRADWLALDSRWSGSHITDTRLPKDYYVTLVPGNWLSNSALHFLNNNSWFHLDGNEGDGREQKFSKVHGSRLV